jgi:hypothetical protein
MKGMTLVLILLVATVAAGALTVASVYLNGSSTKTASLTGVLVVRAPGQSASSASYNVSVSAVNGVGTLTLTRIGGPEDLVVNHSYPVTDVLVSPYNITMMVAGSNVSMGWITTANIWTALNASYSAASGIGKSAAWNDLNSSYVAASGPGADANTTIGQFSPSVFNLPTNYDMFIGVTIPSQPQDQIPFMVAPAASIRTGGEWP